MLRLQIRLKKYRNKKEEMIDIIFAIAMLEICLEIYFSSNILYLITRLEYIMISFQNKKI